MNQATIKLIIIAVVLAAAFGAGWQVNSWRHDAAARKAEAASVAAYNAVRDQNEADLRKSKESSHAVAQGLQNELAQLRAAAAAPQPRLRCSAVQAPVSATGSLSSPGSGADGAAAGPWALPESPEFDPSGPALEVGSQCDEVSARLRALQAFVVGQHELRR